MSFSWLIYASIDGTLKFLYITWIIQHVCENGIILHWVTCGYWMVISNCIKTSISETIYLSLIPSAKQQRYLVKRCNLVIKTKFNWQRNISIETCFLVVKPKTHSLEVLISSQLTSVTQSPSPYNCFWKAHLLSYTSVSGPRVKVRDYIIFPWLPKF